jgi:hypothetical protein
VSEEVRAFSLENIKGCSESLEKCETALKSDEGWEEMRF